MGCILLVEADLGMRDGWATALGAAGHDVIAASEMRDALPLIREGGVDAVIIDAYDTCAGVIELARSIEALPDAPPIIMVSSSPAAPEISARIGAAHFLAKPCEPAELVVAVSRLFGQLRPVRIVEDEDEPTGRTRLFG